VIVVGIGCRKGVTEAAVSGAVRAALSRTDLSIDRISALAAPAFKADETGLQRAAGDMGLPLRLVAQSQLEAMQAGCATRSPKVEEAVGLASVCEAAALAEAGADAILMLPKTVIDGVACAIASGGAE